MFFSKKYSLLILSILLIFVTCPLSKAIYSNPILTETSGKFNTFTIDFRGIDTPNSTYWALCNWGMDLTDFKKTHPDATGGGAYGGLQTVINGKQAIISFWEVLYKENGKEKSHRASRVYPSGDEHSFGGEGEGTNYIHEFDWPTNVWIRFVIHSWTDYLTKRTFVGEWIQNLNTKEWTLFAYFNTNLNNSYIIGGLSQFQENYNAQYNGVERSFQFKNMYTYDRTYKKWISLNSTQLSFDPAEWKFDTSGTHEIGYTNNYFYGSAGLPVDNQKEYDENYPAAIIGSIMQPKTPNFIEPTFKYLLATITSTKITIDWEITSNTCPCYEYEITIQQSNNSGYKTIHTYTTSRPEQKTYTYTSSFKGTYKIGIKANAISATQIYKEITKTI
jgi:hypothetical protein